jgi:hypothetical protein
MSHIPGESLLNIEDALVLPSNPARTDGALDYERCARLHNYLVTCGWMVRHEKGPHELNGIIASAKVP